MPAFFIALNRRATNSDLTPTDRIPAKSIAVLPFETLSESKDDSYFADGVQDEILNNLARIAQLKVISRTSVMQYRGGAKRDLRQIANALGVMNVLEGTVRRAANRVRVNVELVDARNDSTIWADSYDRDLTDIFAIQSEIAKTIARAAHAVTWTLVRSVETSRFAVIAGVLLRNEVCILVRPLRRVVATSGLFEKGPLRRL